MLVEEPVKLTHTDPGTAGEIIDVTLIHRPYLDQG